MIQFQDLIVTLISDQYINFIVILTQVNYHSFFYEVTEIAVVIIFVCLKTEVSYELLIVHVCRFRDHVYQLGARTPLLLPFQYKFHLLKRLYFKFFFAYKLDAAASEYGQFLSKTACFEGKFIYHVGHLLIRHGIPQVFDLAIESLLLVL